MLGFRDAQATVRLLTALNVERFDRCLPLLADEPNAAGIARLFRAWSTCPQVR